MEKIFLALPGNEILASALAKHTAGSIGRMELRKFPDGETYVRINDDVKGTKVILVCSLDYPDEKLLPLNFLAKTAKGLGAAHTCLVAPYLAYMRQDRRFQKGEGITSTYFAAMLSQFVDSLITIDPHLHRRTSLTEIYSIPTTVIHAANKISDWIREHIDNPLLIGPDSESAQWVSSVAVNAHAPYVILAKARLDDTHVDVAVPNVEMYKDHTPVLVDDIISTARTMIETIGHLRKAGMRKPTCIGVHGIFAGNAYDDLLSAGAAEIITCNTIEHRSNRIGIDDLIAPIL
ncbi:MAG: ribose-phosphate pyrophosphokinase [Bacteroidota bacterium]|nr:ribose-phosphate pyrophosphokinase [Bacteroidota bacterium]